MLDFFDKDLLAEQAIKIQKWLIFELPVILILLIAVIVTIKLIRLAINKLKKTMIRRAEKNIHVDTQETEKRINTLIGIIYGIIKVVLIMIVVMIILQKIGVNIAPILASAGIIGLAVGFGAQELVRDVISGFFLLLENQIRTGDVGIINGTGGLVEKIELRTLTLRDFAGVVHVFQNGKINTLSNMTKEWSAMVFDIGVAYKEDVNQVIDIMRQTGLELQNDPEFKDKIIEPIEIMGLDNFADSALVIKARFKTKPIMQWAVGREYRKRLKVAFDKNNIEIPFPHTTVYWGEKIAPLHLQMDKENQQ
ncbi:mechanosensitive ion channel family protein [Saccharicrinis fermentans]|uniref:Small-conductance mechanosensitive channel n=1 Tax=Saccharicrinis fermentans DSM 9555 = JCM 21142 TaxID=869213 RepID=W7YEB0_9BACT|nr:mechanosensitive ion channel family protein [Saccharicrinis fermentans]GAF05803.1 small-conductance mechanosensitive channel [Saccharicrinis fermentans DSM 9555 = JCM 21142]